MAKPTKSDDGFVIAITLNVPRKFFYTIAGEKFSCDPTKFPEASWLAGMYWAVKEKATNKWAPKDAIGPDPDQFPSRQACWAHVMECIEAGDWAMGGGKQASVLRVSFDEWLEVAAKNRAIELAGKDGVWINSGTRGRFLLKADNEADVAFVAKGLAAQEAYRDAQYKVYEKARAAAEAKALDKALNKKNNGAIDIQL